MNLIINKSESTFQAFKQSVSSLWLRGVEKYTNFSNSACYEAITPFSIAITKTIYLSSYIFQDLPPSPLTEAIYKFIKAYPLTSALYDFATTQPIASVVNFLMIGSLFFESRDNITEREKANISKNQEKIIDANIKAVVLAGRYFYTPTTILNLLIVFKIPTSTFFKLAIHVCEAVSIIFSTAEILQSGFGLRSTSKLVEDLNHIRDQAFMDAYHAIQPNSPSLESLSLKNRVKVIKKELKKTNQSTLLKDLVHASNQAFTQAISQKAKNDPESMEKHLKLRPKGLNFKGKSNFLEALSSPKNQSTHENLSKAVSLIKRQLHRKRYSDIFSIVTKAINLAPPIMTFIATYTVINPILLPIGATISLAIATASLIHIIVTERQMHLFIKEMEEATLTT